MPTLNPWTPDHAADLLAQGYSIEHVAAQTGVPAEQLATLAIPPCTSLELAEVLVECLNERQDGA